MNRFRIDLPWYGFFQFNGESHVQIIDQSRKSQRKQIPGQRPGTLGCTQNDQVNQQERKTIRPPVRLTESLPYHRQWTVKHGYDQNYNKNQPVAFNSRIFVENKE